ncbi:MAG: YfiR family protein [Bacteroidetes bacterium]|nr:YfiR family protein [Bacteroidota bacterium]
MNGPGHGIGIVVSKSSLLIGIMGLLAMVVLLCNSSTMSAQSLSSVDETDTRAITKANFLFHFAASNEWPAQAKQGDFYIGIIGNSRLYEELVDKYAMKSIGSQPLKVVAFEDVASFDSDRFIQLIYCDAGGESLRQLATQLIDQPILLVADSEDALEQGAFINFVVKNNRIRYEINQEEAKKRGVLIGNKIMSWAVTPTE